MPLTSDVSTWDGDQLQQELAVRLSLGWTFQIIPDSTIDRWVVNIFNDKMEQVWRGEALTAQLVLLDALGWVETRSISCSETSPWVRRREELNPQRVHEQLFSKLFVKEDPPDLDPSEIQAVYSRTKRG